MLFAELWTEAASCFVVGPQSSSQAGLFLVVEVSVSIVPLEALGWSPLATGDGFASGIPESVTVTPRFSSIFLHEARK